MDSTGVNFICATKGGGWGDCLKSKEIIEKDRAKIDATIYSLKIFLKKVF